jgi:hypothetical protein
VIRSAPARAETLELDPSNPDHTLLMYRKLAHTTDDSVTFWWAHLERYGLVDAALVPFWKVHVAALLTAKDVDDSGAYEANAISLVSYTDLETGKFLETFANPITGNDVPVSYLPPTPRKTLYTRDGPQVKPPQRKGFTITSKHSLISAVEGGDVWVNSDDITRFEPDTPEAGTLFQVSDLNTYHGLLKDVANAEVSSAPATWDFQDILSWPPWLEMGDRPGYYVSRGYGRKVSSFDEMPSDTLALVKMRFPKIYADPVAALS